MKRLIVNADDFGRTPGVNAGVLEAHLSGIVTSATVMVLEPAAEAGVSEASRRARGLSLGLHFVLTGGGAPASPAERVASLLVGGRFPRDAQSLPSEIDPDDVSRELDAQIALFTKMAGRPPSHLDSHHHSALHPSVQPVFAEAARRRGLPVRASTAAARDALRASGVTTPDRFLDGFYGAGATAENLRAILAELSEEETSELMCHPAVVDEELRASSSYAEPRAAELDALTSREARQTVQASGIRLIHFGQL